MQSKGMSRAHHSSQANKRTQVKKNNARKQKEPSSKSNSQKKSQKSLEAEFSWLFEGFERFLQHKNLKHTSQRDVILKKFLVQRNLHEEHISAEDLHREVKDEGHAIGLATIYRTLNLLREAGFVDQKQFSDGRAVFELKTPGHHHDHLVCLDCRKVVEFENPKIEQLQIEVATEHNFTLVDHNLDLFGYCGDCRKNNPQTKLF